MRKVIAYPVVALCVAGFLQLTFAGGADNGPAALPPSDSTAKSSAPTTAIPVPTNPLNAQRAYGYLNQICAIGPRISGTPGMKKQQELLKAHFTNLGGKVTLQPFSASNPEGGADVPMANMIVEWHP